MTIEAWNIPGPNSPAARPDGALWLGASVSAFVPPLYAPAMGDSDGTVNCFELSDDRPAAGNWQ